MPACKQCLNRKVIISAGETVAIATACPLCVASCQRCSGRGYQIVERNGYEYAVDCSCQGNTKLLWTFNSTQIPSLYADKLFSSFGADDYAVSSAQQEAQEAIFRWSRSYQTGDSGFVLYGPYGTGKTLLMCQALSILSLQFGVQCKYVEFSLLMQAMKERISEKTSDGDIKSPLRTVPVLAVDELGKVRGTEWELSELDALVAFRYQTGKTTLFASNFDERELEKRVGGRIFSRLKERCRFMNVSGDDFRRRIK